MIRYLPIAKPNDPTADREVIRILTNKGYRWLNSQNDRSFRPLHGYSYIILYPTLEMGRTNHVPDHAVEMFIHPDNKLLVQQLRAVAPQLVDPQKVLDFLDLIPLDSLPYDLLLFKQQAARQVANG